MVDFPWFSTSMFEKRVTCWENSSIASILLLKNMTKHGKTRPLIESYSFWLGNQIQNESLVFGNWEVTIKTNGRIDPRKYGLKHQQCGMCSFTLRYAGYVCWTLGHGILNKYGISVFDMDKQYRMKKIRKEWSQLSNYPIYSDIPYVFSRLGVISEH
jgi:hypothetical protein